MNVGMCSEVPERTMRESMEVRAQVCVILTLQEVMMVGAQSKQKCMF